MHTSEAHVQGTCAKLCFEGTIEDTFPETPAPRVARLVDTNYPPNWMCASPKSSSIYTCCVYIHTRTCIRRHPARRFESVAIMPKLRYIHMYHVSIYLCIYVPMYIICIIMYTYNCIYICLRVKMYTCIYIYLYINV